MRRLILLAPLALAACVAPQPAPPTRPAPPPRPVATPAPPPVAWEDGPAAPGDWTWTRTAAGSSAAFGVAGQDATFTVGCDAARRIVTLVVPGLAAPGATLTIQTSDGARGFPVAPLDPAPPGTAPKAGVALSASDGFLDRIAFSRGRFRIRLGGNAPVVIPAWPEFARTIEDCRP